MRNPSVVLCLLLGLGVLLPAGAGERYVPLQQRLSAGQLEALGLSARQVALLDQWLAESEPASPAPATAANAEAAAAPMTASAVSAPASVGDDGDPTTRNGVQYIGLDTGPIKARARGAVTGWEPGTVFRLDNGQEWTVLKGRMQLRQPLQDPPIVLVPGIAGRWFLQVDPDLPKARVYRAD